jgi:predicted nucleic acid-binding protein
MSVVIDSSYALACMLPDERRPESMDAVLAQVLLTPFTWPIEIASALRNGLRHQRFSAAQAGALAENVSALGARVVPPWHDDPGRYLAFAMTHGLTPYDALYIDLCLGERSALATRDAGLSSAAARVGIRVHS